MITGITSIAMFEAKYAYERVALSYNATVKAYYIDSLRFNDNNFRGECIKVGQQLTHCGVDAHHQNTVTETKIKEV